MAEIKKVNGQYGTYFYIDSSSAKDVLRLNQMITNVQYLLNVCASKYSAWTIAALAALCGNGQSEGALNPSQWQYGLGMSESGGYGLWQWTPATKFLDWCTENNYDRKAPEYQLARLEFERSTGIQYYKTEKYNFSFTSFLEEDHSVDTLARAWLYNYERPKDPAASEAIRVQRSEYWYEVLTGQTPEPPGPDPGPDPDPPTPETVQRQMPFFLFPAWRKL